MPDFVRRSLPASKGRFCLSAVSPSDYGSQLTGSRAAGLAAYILGEGFEFKGFEIGILVAQACFLAATPLQPTSNTHDLSTRNGLRLSTTYASYHQETPKPGNQECTLSTILHRLQNLLVLSKLRTGNLSRGQKGRDEIIGEGGCFLGQVMASLGFCL